MRTLHTRFCTRLAPSCMLSRWLSTKISASELSRNFIKEVRCWSGRYVRSPIHTCLSLSHAFSWMEFFSFHSSLSLSSHFNFWGRMWIDDEFSSSSPFSPPPPRVSVWHFAQMGPYFFTLKKSILLIRISLCCIWRLLSTLFFPSSSCLDDALFSHPPFFNPPSPFDKDRLISFVQRRQGDSYIVYFSSLH